MAIILRNIMRSHSAATRRTRITKTERDQLAMLVAVGLLHGDDE